MHGGACGTLLGSRADRLFEYLNIRNTGNITERDFVRMLVVPELPFRKGDRLPDGTMPDPNMGRPTNDPEVTRNAMYQICDSLEVANMSPNSVRPHCHVARCVQCRILASPHDVSRVPCRQAFEAFDTNASGSISTSEFMSLMRTIGGPDFPRTHLLHLMASMDSDTDRCDRWRLQRVGDVTWLTFAKWLLCGVSHAGASPSESLRRCLAWSGPSGSWS